MIPGAILPEFHVWYLVAVMLDQKVTLKIFRATEETADLAAFEMSENVTIPHIHLVRDGSVKCVYQNGNRIQGGGTL